MKNAINIALIFIGFSLVAGIAGAEEQLPAPPQEVNTVYPRLACGVLTFAKLGELPQGVVMRADEIEITIEHLNTFIAKQPKGFRELVKKNAFFALEQQAAEKLLLKLAKNKLASAGKKLHGKADREIIKNYLDGLMENVKVADEDVIQFYKENEGSFCGTPFEKIKDRLRPYVLEEKRKRYVGEYIRTMGKRIDIVVSAPWVKDQALLAKDNPLDKARRAKKPAFAVFGGASCCGPDKMAPVVKSLRSKYSKEISIVHLDTRKEQILAARYEVRSIPTQIFYDRTGKEVFRYVGFLSPQDIEKRLTQMGVK